MNLDKTLKKHLTNLEMDLEKVIVIVKEIIDKFSDYDEVPMDELIKLAKELPDGKGKDVIIGLGVGAWRGDEPEEEEFFRIIDSKY